MTISRKHARENHSRFSSEEGLIQRVLDQLAEFVEFAVRALNRDARKLVPVPVPARKPSPQCPRSSDRRHGYLQS